MTIAITGATGQLGRLVIRKIRARRPTAELIALVRSAAKAADLGIATRLADYDRPGTLDAALQGVDTLMLISSRISIVRSRPRRKPDRRCKCPGRHRQRRQPPSTAEDGLRGGRLCCRRGLPML